MTGDRAMTEEMDESEGVAKVVPIEWQIPDDVVPRYATNMLVQHTEHEFIISFFETWPPAILGTPEDMKAQIEAVRSLPARCVGRVIVAADRMPGFLRALQENLEKYRAKQEDE
jgi:hypothetical protein